jgi:TolB-like protein
MLVMSIITPLQKSNKRGTMKKTLIALALATLASPLFANPAIAVIDFDGGDYCTAQKAAIMTGLFRNELVRSGRADIVDRKNMDRVIAEHKFQMSDWANPAKIKQMGLMIGADYLMTGNFDMLGSNLYLVVQMLDIETARAVYSSRMILATWDEYDWKVRGFADEVIKRLPAENIFSGAWTADIPHDGVIDIYTITFTGANRCAVRVTSLVSGRELSEEAQGSYSYDGDILKITAVLRNSKIPHLNSIQWSSVISIAEGSRSFNMLAKPVSTSGNQVRVTFTKE